MHSSDPSIVKLFDETGESLSSIVEGDSEVGEPPIVLLISGRTLGKPISVVINLLLEVGDVGLESFHLLSVDIVSNPDHSSESVDD